jgi:hypothetical protein
MSAMSNTLLFMEHKSYKSVSIQRMLIGVVMFNFFLTVSLGAGETYRKMMILEMTPSELEGLSIGTARAYVGNPSSHPIDGHFTSSYVVGNGGSLFFLGQNSVIRLEPSAREFSQIRVTGSDIQRPMGLWLGPEDEIYVHLVENRGFHDRPGKVVRFIRGKEGYRLDEDFNIPASLQYSRDNLYPITPNGQILIYFRGQNKIQVYNPRGEFVKEAEAAGITSNGVEFHVVNTIDKTHDGTFDSKGILISRLWNTEVKGVPEATLFSITDSSNYRYTKATSTDEIVLTSLTPVHEWLPDITHLPTHEWLPDSAHPTIHVWIPPRTHLVTVKPTILIINAVDWSYQRIDTRELSRSDYAYFNVSGVDANFKGEVFALVIYFNTPGKVTDDDLIVFYKWARQ